MLKTLGPETIQSTSWGAVELSKPTTTVLRPNAGGHEKTIMSLQLPVGAVAVPLGVKPLSGEPPGRIAKLQPKGITMLV
jgi:hypothetical protein